MSIQEVSPEQLAELFHHYHQALAPDFGFANAVGNEAWERVPQQEKNRLVGERYLNPILPPRVGSGKLLA